MVIGHSRQQSISDQVDAVHAGELSAGRLAAQTRAEIIGSEHRLRAWTALSDELAADEFTADAPPTGTGLLPLRAAEKGVRVFAELPDRNLYIQGESVLVGQVIINACVNALDEISQPTTDVKELALSTGEADGYAFVAVRDQGRGIGEVPVPTLAGGTPSTKVDGSGIGLLISEHIVERHGGTIEFLPNEPRGTVVKISLPLADEGAAATASDSRTGG